MNGRSKTFQARGNLPWPPDPRRPSRTPRLKPSRRLRNGSPRCAVGCCRPTTTCLAPPTC